MRPPGLATAFDRFLHSALCTLCLCGAAGIAGCSAPPGDLGTIRAASPAVAELVEAIDVGTIGGARPTLSAERLTDDRVKVTLRYDLPERVQQDDVRITIHPSFTADFHWSPHLTPTDSHVVDQHSFRSPAVLMADGGHLLTLIPDIDLLLKGTQNRWYLDLDAPANVITIGMGNRKITEHTLYRRDVGATYEPGVVEIGFYLIGTRDPDKIADPWRDVLALLWGGWGHDLYASGQPLRGDMLPYVKRTYDWAFRNWPAVWQEFTLNGTRVGAPQFIVNITQSPNYEGEPRQREMLSIWNQAWFSSLRSASGVYRYARANGDDELLEKARLTKKLALAFPQDDGLFDAVIAVEDEHTAEADTPEEHAVVWGTAYFGNSNRNPYATNGSLKLSPRHILDMSWTAYQMLLWYNELEADPRLLAYARRYADRLLTLQTDRGYFPGWVTKSGEPYQHLNESPETSMSVTFLLKLSELTGDGRYFDAARMALDVVMEEIVPAGRWEDFETYWSCSRYNSDVWYGHKIERNDMYKQNTLSIFWTAQALLEMYRRTGEDRYLAVGRRTLDELLMTQASWQPPYIHIEALGGFGVMNGDGEWNDSRQSLFAELIVQYGVELDVPEYIERGLAAMRASFIMLYGPENPGTKALWEAKWPHFGEADFGFMMENYGHGGYSDARGAGIGEFTIYDWGNGAAAEAYLRMTDHFGKTFVDGR